MFVEVQETHLGTPGPGTVRRWRREAPEGFRFALLGPREIGQEGFREGKVVETAMKTLVAIAKELDATTAVFVTPPEFPANRTNRTAVREFLQVTRKRFSTVVFEPGPLWDPDETEALLADLGVLVVRDPLHQKTSKLAVAYYRLPGPAGHKSRYEDPAIERLADIAKATKHKDATYIFTNVDMFADAKRFRKAMKL
jgi:uncharacterized protein YecE (DUF72 family)